MAYLGLLDEPLSLDEHLRQSFDEEGFVKIKGALDEDVIGILQPKITDKVIEFNTMDVPVEQRLTYDKTFLQVGQLRFQSVVARAFVFSKRLAKAAAELLAVRLYSNQALYKEGGGAIIAWHVDQGYWSLASDHACTVRIPLQETPLEMGPISFAAKSHRFACGPDLRIGDESEAAIEETIEVQNLDVIDEPYEPAEVSYHLGWTFIGLAPIAPPPRGA
jgi:ectoine hydroxylase-related dioxygenase (phytanoyl-CoA dioxygenase family)